MVPRAPLLTKGLSSPNPYPRRDANQGPSAWLQAHVHPLGLRSIRAAIACPFCFSCSGRQQA